MNFETGVISASSLSIGACAEAPPAAPVSNRTASARTPSRLIVLSSLRLTARPAAGALHRPPPRLDLGLARGSTERRREAPLERPATGEVVERAPQAGAEAREVRGTQRRRLDHGGPQHGDIDHV